jgi:hypothetical protein
MSMANQQLALGTIRKAFTRVTLLDNVAILGHFFFAATNRFFLWKHKLDNLTGNETR